MNIVIHPEYYALQEEIKKLRENLSQLFLRRDELVCHVCPNVQADYMLKVGAFEYKLYELDCMTARLRRKLESGDYPESCVDDAMEYVSSYGYIDDLRYSMNYIDYHRESKSQNSIKLDLIKKGVDKSTIERAFSETDPPTEEDQIRGWLDKKHFEDFKDDQKEKYRIYQFLLRKGYKSEDILRAMR